jgi:hypothetical protein
MLMIVVYVTDTLADRELGYVGLDDLERALDIVSRAIQASRRYRDDH